MAATAFLVGRARRTEQHEQRDRQREEKRPDIGVVDIERGMEPPVGAAEHDKGNRRDSHERPAAHSRETILDVGNVGRLGEIDVRNPGIVGTHVPHRHPCEDLLEEAVERIIVARHTRPFYETAVKERNT